MVPDRSCAEGSQRLGVMVYQILRKKLTALHAEPARWDGDCRQHRAHPVSIAGIWVLSSGQKSWSRAQQNWCAVPSLSHSQLSVWGPGSVIPTHHGSVLSVWEQHLGGRLKAGSPWSVSLRAEVWWESHAEWQGMPTWPAKSWLTSTRTTSTPLHCFWVLFLVLKETPAVSAPGCSQWLEEHCRRRVKTLVMEGNKEVGKSYMNLFSSCCWAPVALCSESPASAGHGNSEGKYSCFIAQSDKPLGKVET